jgi:hypothetical protein
MVTNGLLDNDTSKFALAVSADTCIGILFDSGTCIAIRIKCTKNVAS